METDVTMPDDPPEKEESSKETTQDAKPLKDYRELSTKEPSEEFHDGLCINQDGQDDASAEEAGTDNLQTARKASKKSPCKMQQGAVFSGKILSFCCSECKGDTTYSPNDLLKHFQGSHKGTLPTYPCDLCSFVTNEFSSLQRHRIGHRNPQVTCEICNDGVQYSLLLLTRHYIMCHSQNGHFRCEKCEFSTRDAGTFVQHIHYHNEGRHKCVKCMYVSPSRRELQRHLLVHSATFPFTCHFCGYGAARKDYLTKHMATAHCEENDRKSRWKMMEENPCMTSPPGLKLLLKKGPVAGGSREPQWMSKLNTLPGVGLLDQNGRLYNPEKTLEETQQFLERAVRVKKENSLWMKSAVKTEPQCSYPSSPATPQPKPPEMDSSHGSGLLNPNNSNGLTVLMVKNKISIPPNCTTKVMGFKMVDGKKHLVLKVIPTKQEPSSEGASDEKELDSQSTDGTTNEPKYSSDDGEKSYNSSCSVMSSPLGSLLRPDSMESSTAGETNALAKPMKVTDVVNDMDDELPMEVESVGDVEQSRRFGRQKCTSLHENCLEDVPYLPFSQCESAASSMTKESETTVHQSNGEIHSENNFSSADPLKSTIDSTHLNSPSDSDENQPQTAHSTLNKAIILDSVTGRNSPLKSHSFTATIMPSDSVKDMYSDLSDNMTMAPHSAENDVCPAKSFKDSVVDTDSKTDATQSDVVQCQGTSLEADSNADSHSTDNELTSPNSEAVSSDLMVPEKEPSDSAEDKGMISDSANEKDKIGVSTEDKATSSNSKEARETHSGFIEVSATAPHFVLKTKSSDSCDKSSLSESGEETDRFHSVESRTSEIVGDDCRSLKLMEDNTLLPDIAEVRDGTSNSVEDKVLPGQDSGATKNSFEVTSPDTVRNQERISDSPENNGTSSLPSVDMNLATEDNGTDSSSLCIQSSESSMEKVMPSELGVHNVKHLKIDVATPSNSCEKDRTSQTAPNTESVLSQAAHDVKEPRDADCSVKENKIPDLLTKKNTALQSTLEVLTATNAYAAEIEPSSRSEEPDSLSASAKDGIVFSKANDESPVIDAVPLSLMFKSSPRPMSDSNSLPEEVVEAASSKTFSSCSAHTDLDESQKINTNSLPISEQQPDNSDSEPPLSCAKATNSESREGNDKVSIKSRTKNSCYSQEHHFVREDQSPNRSPCGTKVSELFCDESGYHTVPETDTVDKSDVLNDKSDVLNSATHSPNQEVFSFHNYSKETSGCFPATLLSDEQGRGQYNEREEVDEDDCSDVKLSADWSLTLDASPPHRSHCEEEEFHMSKTLSTDEGDLCNNSIGTLERVSDSDIEVDECIAAVDEPSNSAEKQPSVQTTPSVSNKVEEDSITVGQRGQGIKNDVAVLGRILEKHSDAIINHQLEKERMGSSTVAYDSVRPTKTTLKILQTPEGKQQMFLQTPDNQYAVPVQLKSAPGFKLITKSSASKINVSYVQPGIERSSKTTGLALTLSGGRLGIGGQTSSGGDKGPTHLSPVQLGTSSSGGHYLVNSASLKSPILLSSAVKSPTGEQTTNRAPTCYLLQRPLPISPVNGSSSVDSTGSNLQTQQSSHSVLAMPVKSVDKTSPLQTGRQAYLVRYISPAKSGILLNNVEGKTASSTAQSNESGRSRVFLKIVRGPNGTRFLSNVPGSLGKKPIYLATGGALQSPCFLMSSNKSIVNFSSGLKASNLPHGSNLQQDTSTQLPSTLPEDGVMPHRKSHYPLNQIRMSQRKRRRKALFDDMVETSSKARRLSSRSERDEPAEWTPVPKDVERTLRLSPFSAFQHIKVPRQNQPVVVLNHPDADIPEVVSIMRSVNRFKGDVLKVALSQRTVQALSEVSLSGVLQPGPSPPKSTMPHGSARARLFGSTVRERFILKLKLKKMSRNRYEVVRKSSPNGSAEQPSTFSCWFCGRIFNNQEDWIGHGQRHLMEATRDWNTLFKNGLC